MKRILQLVLLGVLTAAWGSGLTQDRSISGRITSQDDGQAVPGVNVLVKGTSIGAVTDVDGRYTIGLPEQNSILVFSFIGFKTQEVEAGDRTIIDVTMAQDYQQLSEVVVTAL